MKKKLISILMMACVLAVPCPGAFSQYNGKAINRDLNASEAADHIILTWTGDPSTTQTVTWRAKSTVSGAALEYRESASRGARWLAMKAVEEIFTTVPDDAEGSMKIFSATLSGLKPDAAYRYRIRSGSTAGPEYGFRTAPRKNGEFTFLVFGDSQSDRPDEPDYTPWHKTITQAHARVNHARFLVITGDLVDVGQNYIHWQNWFEAARDVIARIPLAAVQGNHENYTVTRRANSAPVYFSRQLKMPGNGPEGMKGRVYSFDYGDAHLVVLDSQQEEEYDIYGDILKAQAEWLEKDLAGTRKTWKLAFFHRPPYYNYRLRSNGDIRSAFCPVFDKYRVDVVFSGHDHTVSRTYPIRGGKLFSRPEDGTVYYLTGRSGGKFREDMPAKTWNALFHNPVGQPCYSTVTIGRGTLKIDTFKQDGTVIDRYVIDKSGGNRSTATPAPRRYPAAMAAVNGVVLPTPVDRVPAGNGGQWFINIGEFVAYLKGGITGMPGDVEITLKEGRYTIPADKTRLNGKNVLTVSADGIQSIMGFSYWYDDSMNIVFFEKPPELKTGK